MRIKVYVVEAKGQLKLHNTICPKFKVPPLTNYMPILEASG